MVSFFRITPPGTKLAVFCRLVSPEFYKRSTVGIPDDLVERREGSVADDIRELALAEGALGRSSSPLLLGVALHGRCIRVLHFEPVRRAAGAIRRALALRILSRDATPFRAQEMPRLWSRGEDQTG